MKALRRQYRNNCEKWGTWGTVERESRIINTWNHCEAMHGTTVKSEFIYKTIVNKVRRLMKQTWKVRPHMKQLWKMRTWGGNTWNNCERWYSENINIWENFEKQGFETSIQDTIGKNQSEDMIMASSTAWMIQTECKLLELTVRQSILKERGRELKWIYFLLLGQIM